MLRHTCLVLPGLLMLSLCAEELQTWNSKNGHSFQGYFLSREPFSVKLKGEDGRVITVPLSALDESSLQQADEAFLSAAAGAPIFTHENPYLRYALYPERDWLRVEFLRGGRPLHPEPIVLRFDHAEVRTTRWTPMKFKKMLGDPVRTRDEVELRFEMSNGVIVRLFTKIGRTEELEFRYELDPAPEGLPPLHARVRLDVPVILSYDDDLEAYTGSFSSSPLAFKNLPRVLEGYELLMRSREKQFKGPYYEKQQDNFKGNQAEIRHPHWPVLSLRRTGAPASMRSRFYGGKLPASGYTIYFEPDDPKHPLQKGGPFTISVKP
ncbi:hypothetical protein P0Y35_18480 [Kiritimatiellaeota bacterium B1221]|nr:hypothetical protein [Kiritimatiellaeota bacterium B1221]